MKIVGISMIGNDADIVEPFVRHNLGLFEHLVVIVHCARDGTGEILNALQGEGLSLTLVIDDAYATLARFTEALIRRRPGNLEGMRFEHASASPAMSDSQPGRVAGAKLT